MKTGIILVALGYELYGSCALNLAMSIKSYEPDIPILLVHDNGSIAHLTKQEKEIFDILKVADPSDYTLGESKQYQRMKLCVNKYTDFENSLYIDVDTIWFPGRNASELIENLTEFDFYIGKNGQFDPKTGRRSNQSYTYWEDPAKISRYFKLKNIIPQTISGVFFFKKNEYTEKIFNRAQEIYNDTNAPCMLWGGGKPDEYCFNIALSEAGFQQDDTHFVYFEAINGNISRRQMYENFWGIAIGGSELTLKVKSLYNELVDLFTQVWPFRKLYSVDKQDFILARKKF